MPVVTVSDLSVDVTFVDDRKDLVGVLPPMSDASSCDRIVTSHFLWNIQTNRAVHVPSARSARDAPPFPRTVVRNHSEEALCLENETPSFMSVVVCEDRTCLG